MPGTKQSRGRPVAEPQAGSQQRFLKLRNSEGPDGQDRRELEQLAASNPFELALVDSRFHAAARKRIVYPANGIPGDGKSYNPFEESD